MRNMLEEDEQMKYMVLIYGNYSAAENQTEADVEAEMAAYRELNEAAAKAGVLVAGEALMPPIMATTVQVRAGKTLTTDGPYAETKEQIGGFYIFDVPSLEEATHWAARIPGAADGSCEVREIVTFE
jgi:hypothetical protein